MDPMVGNRTSRKEFLNAMVGGVICAGCGGLLSGCGSALTEKFSVAPSRARCDEPFIVRLRDLSPGERVALSAAFNDARGEEWSSAAIFEADGDGMVDTSAQAPVEGSYGVRDPMGLVWSAEPPVAFYAPPLPASSVRLRAKVGDEEGKIRVERYALADGAEVEDVREDGLVGRLFSPAGQAMAPGVLVLGGSEGGIHPNVEREAALLASRGYAALALAYFRGRFFEPEGAGELPYTVTRIPLEYFERAIRWLGEKEGVRGGRLGALGHSRGGELALLLGATYPELKAVVSYVGSGVVASSPLGDSPWTLEGEPVPYVEGFTEGLGFSSEITRQEIEEAETPVEEINGPVLLIAGGDDTMVPERISRVAYDRLERHDRPHDDEFAFYPEAGHLLGAPYVPTGYSLSRFGGTAEANAAANEDSWRKVLALLNGHLKE